MMYKFGSIDVYILSLILLAICNKSRLVRSLENNLARKPPMGWLSWVRFTCDTDCSVADGNNCISQRLYSRMAKAMKDKGFVQSGYHYVNIDDCWSERQRDATGSLVPHKERFNGTSGLKNLVKELKDLDQHLKLGIYGDCGTATCAGYPAQLNQNDSLTDNYFKKDAETFYDWGIESFKFDGCFITPTKSEELCPKMTYALKEAQKSDPILLTCEWPYYMMSTRHVEQPLKVDWNLAKSSCNLWRYYEDIYDSWLSITSIIDYSVGMQEEILKHHGPGGWFDADQLVVGGFGLSHDQARVHMALWSFWSAPLFMSNDIEKLSPRDSKLLQNKELIAINQDELGIWGQMVMELEGSNWAMGKMQVFVKPISPEKSEDECPDFAIAYFYRGALGNSVKYSLKLRDILQKSSNVIQEANKRRFKDFERCLERINGVGSNPMKGFSVIDLLDDVEKKNKNLALDDDLTLVVNPTGIRAVKLIQLQYEPSKTTTTTTTTTSTTTKPST